MLQLFHGDCRPAGGTTDLMLATGDDDFDDFQAAPGQYGNPPPAAPLTPEVPIPSLGAGKEGTRQPLASNLFGGGDPEEEEEWGDFATVPANGSAAPQHQSLPAAAPARAAAPPAAAGSRGALRKLDAVWYLDGRTGSWVEAKVCPPRPAKAMVVLRHAASAPPPAPPWVCSAAASAAGLQVVSVDVSIQPPSYCVQLRSNGAFRETERHRLRPLLPGMPPPAGAEEGPAPAFAAHPPAAGHPPVPVHSGANGHAMPAAAAAPAPAAALGEEEDEFGDFAAAAAPPAPPPMPSFAHTHPAAASVLPAAPRAAPASPFVAPAAPGAAAAAPAAAPPPGSPRRLPSRRSSTGAGWECASRGLQPSSLPQGCPASQSCLHSLQLPPSNAPPMPQTPPRPSCSASAASCTQPLPGWQISWRRRSGSSSRWRRSSSSSSRKMSLESLRAEALRRRRSSSRHRRRPRGCSAMRRCLWICLEMRVWRMRRLSWRQQRLQHQPRALQQAHWRTHGSSISSRRTARRRLRSSTTCPPHSPTQRAGCWLWIMPTAFCGRRQALCRQHGNPQQSRRQQQLRRMGQLWLVACPWRHQQRQQLQWQEAGMRARMAALMTLWGLRARPSRWLPSNQRHSCPSRHLQPAQQQSRQAARRAVWQQQCLHRRCLLRGCSRARCCLWICLEMRVWRMCRLSWCQHWKHQHQHQPCSQQRLSTQSSRPQRQPVSWSSSSRRRRLISSSTRPAHSPTQQAGCWVWIMPTALCGRRQSMQLSRQGQAAGRRRRRRRMPVLVTLQPLQRKLQLEMHRRKRSSRLLLLWVRKPVGTMARKLAAAWKHHRPLHRRLPRGCSREWRCLWTCLEMRVWRMRRLSWWQSRRLGLAVLQQWLTRCSIRHGRSSRHGSRKSSRPKGNPSCPWQGWWQQPQQQPLQQQPLRWQQQRPAGGMTTRTAALLISWVRKQVLLAWTSSPGSSSLQRRLPWKLARQVAG